MKLRIKHKLFLLLLSVNLMLATGIFLLNSWSFSAGFVEYIKHTEQQRFTPFMAELVKQYRAEGNWLWINQQHQQWSYLIRHYIREGHDQPLADGFLARLPERDAHSQPPMRRPQRDLRFARRLGPERFDSERPPRGLHPPGSSSRPHPRRSLSPRANDNATLSIDPHLLLQNAQHQLIIGPKRNQKQVLWIPIRDAETIIGYLGFRQLKHLDEELNQLFADQQKKSFLYAALAMVLFSGLVTLPVAQRLVRPLQQLAKATEKLAAGDYNTRFERQSSDELGDLARDFNSLSLTLQKNLRARQQWIADISHELRTPVAVLQGEIEALQDGVRKTNQHALDSLHQEISRLNSLINDLHELTLADLGALNYHKEVLDLAELITDRIEVFELQLAEKNLTIDTQWSPAEHLIWADERRMVQVITNLLQNSLRYTNAGGTVQVSLLRLDDHYQLNWSDSKPGVDPQHLSHLFDRLYRVEQSRNRSQGGSGLGLAITQTIIDAHDGTIEAQPSKLGGLMIRINLPIHG